MKTLDIIAAILLIIGGLNWLIIGLFGTEAGLVANLFGGPEAIVSRVVYVVVGLAALWLLIFFWSIPQRWETEEREPTPARV